MNEISRRQRSAERERAEVERFATIFERCRVNVLLVADAFLCFSDEEFGLSELVSIMQASPLHVRFAITSAHRGDPGAMRLNGATANFVFTDAALQGVDELWLFAADSSGSLPEAEVLAITKFMQAGGGVFATGGHGNLGATLCGEIPRVRSMRKWHSSASGDQPHATAPDDSNDPQTERKRGRRNTAPPFDELQDAVPHPISPKFYTRKLTPRLVEKYPHPVLCGPHGAIRVLPVHPHECECIVPIALDRTLDIGHSREARSLDEYPMNAAGLRVSPDVIATSTMTTPGDATATQRGAAGTVGVYDGHRASIGRVVVDATWHQFINRNLTGGLAGYDAQKRVGLLHANAGDAGATERARLKRDCDQIRGYFHNIGTWLAPLTSQRYMTQWTLRYVAKSNPLFDEIANIDSEKLLLHEYVRLGATAYQRLRTFVRPCGALKLAIDVLPPFREQLPWPSDPWAPNAAPDVDPRVFALDPVTIELANLGAIVVEMHRVDGKVQKRADEDALARAVECGQQRSAEVLMTAVRELAAALSHVVKSTRADVEISSCNQVASKNGL